MKKNKIVIASIFIVIVIMIVTILIINKNSTKGNTVVTVFWAYDTSTPEKAIECNDYVFVAKINKLLRTEYRNHGEIKTGLFRKETESTPFTIYELEVLENIKGELDTTKPIELAQMRWNKRR